MAGHGLSAGCTVRFRTVAVGGPHGDIGSIGRSKYGSRVDVTKADGADVGVARRG